MTRDNPEMTSHDVLEIVGLFQKNDIDIVIDGGWGMDALLGKQTRRHQGLDVAVNHQDVPQIIALLEERGYQEIPRDDSWECNFVLGDSQGHLFDLHSCTFDEAGNNVFGVKYPFDSWNGKGLINAYPVKCITPEWMVKFHTWYTTDENDNHDVKLLCTRFGIEIPEEYKDFVLNERQL
jgi:lincosamide nucleotidyltransferase A/C/D/E